MTVSELGFRDIDRWRLTERLRDALLERESPRLQMFLLVGLAGAGGFLASVTLLRLGLERLPVRYVLSVAIAYVVFLALLYAWILRRRSQAGSGTELSESAGTDSIDIDSLDLSDVVPSSVPDFTGGGGRFGGGGASSSWSSTHAGFSSGGDGDGDVSADPDGDGGWILLIFAAAAAVLFGASIWIVMVAPSLFAELLLDGVLSAGLYRRLSRLPQRPWLETAVRPWLETAVRRTVLPFLFVAVTLGIVGKVMEIYAPEARSLGGVLAHGDRP